MMRRGGVPFCKVLLLVTLGFTAINAGNITDDNYPNQLPQPAGKIIRQTDANVHFQLYGNPESASYSDKSHIDGIDDGLGGHLSEIAARFSPVLFRKNFSVPRSFSRMLNLQYNDDTKELTFNRRPALVTNTWDRTKAGIVRIGSDTILFRQFGPSASTSQGSRKQPESAEAIAKLRYLVDQHGPFTVESRSAPPVGDSVITMYLDFPGDSQASWRMIYRKLAEIECESSVNDCFESVIYTHPFIHPSNSGRDSTYEFVLQYWFFYPFNDGGNDHEGDWEHMNVRLGTPSYPRGRLPSHEIRRILDTTNSGFIDSLTVGKVEYYFHEQVATVDFALIRTDLDTLTESQFWQSQLLLAEATIDSLISDSTATKSIPVEDRADSVTAIESRISFARRLQVLHREFLSHDSASGMHPPAFIGGENVGPDQIATLPRWWFLGEPFDQNSHGSYPLPGKWKNIGPLGATERIREIGKESECNGIQALRYARDDLILVPDWERLLIPIRTSDQAVRDWSWLTLPVFWGFPVSQSKFAGMIPNVSVGNVAPSGPAYNKGWNRIDQTSGYHIYQPHILIGSEASLFNMSPFDRVSTQWGFVNLLAFPVVQSPPITYLLDLFGILCGRHSIPMIVPDYRPRRYFTSAGGVITTRHQSKYARLLPQKEDSAIMSYISSKGGVGLQATQLRHETASMPVFRMTRLLGDDISTENSYSWGDSKVSYVLSDATGAPMGKVTGTMSVRDVGGSLKFNLGQMGNGWLSCFLRAGLGWVVYKVKDAQLVGDTVIQLPNSGWFHSPEWKRPWTWTPNYWSTGLGFDLRTGLIRNTRLIPVFFDIGIMVEVGLTVQRHLGSDAILGGRGDIRVTRKQFSAGLFITMGV